MFLEDFGLEVVFITHGHGLLSLGSVENVARDSVVTKVRKTCFFFTFSHVGSSWHQSFLIKIYDQVPSHEHVLCNDEVNLCKAWPYTFCNIHQYHLENENG